MFLLRPCRRSGRSADLFQDLLSETAVCNSNTIPGFRESWRKLRGFSVISLCFTEVSAKQSFARPRPPGREPARGDPARQPFAGKECPAFPKQSQPVRQTGLRLEASVPCQDSPPEVVLKAFMLPYKVIHDPGFCSDLRCIASRIQVSATYNRRTGIILAPEVVLILILNEVQTLLRRVGLIALLLVLPA